MDLEPDVGVRTVGWCSLLPEGQLLQIFARARGPHPPTPPPPSGEGRSPGLSRRQGHQPLLKGAESLKMRNRP